MDSSGRTAQEDLAKQKSLPKTFIIQADQQPEAIKTAVPHANTAYGTAANILWYHSLKGEGLAQAEVVGRIAHQSLKLASLCLPR